MRGGTENESASALVKAALKKAMRRERQINQNISAGVNNNIMDSYAVGGNASDSDEV